MAGVSRRSAQFYRKGYGQPEDGGSGKEERRIAKVWRACSFPRPTNVADSRTAKMGDLLDMVSGNQRCVGVRGEMVCWIRKKNPATRNPSPAAHFENPGSVNRKRGGGGRAPSFSFRSIPPS